MKPLVHLTTDFSRLECGQAVGEMNSYGNTGADITCKACRRTRVFKNYRTGQLNREEAASTLISLLSDLGIRAEIAGGMHMEAVKINEKGVARLTEMLTLVRALSNVSESGQ